MCRKISLLLSLLNLPLSSWGVRAQLTVQESATQLGASCGSWMWGTAAELSGQGPTGRRIRICCTIFLMQVCPCAWLGVLSYRKPQCEVSSFVPSWFCEITLFNMSKGYNTGVLRLNFKQSAYFILLFFLTSVPKWTFYKSLDIPCALRCNSWDIIVKYGYHQDILIFKYKTIQSLDSCKIAMFLK